LIASDYIGHVDFLGSPSTTGQESASDTNGHHRPELLRRRLRLAIAEGELSPSVHWSTPPTVNGSWSPLTNPPNTKAPENLTGESPARP
jgi:hypothetical protein